MATLSRRSLLAAATAAMIPAIREACAAPPRPEIGIQIYQFADDARRDLSAVLATISSLGYRNVELFGGMGLPSQVAALVRRNGLSVPSLVVTPVPLMPGLPDLSNNIEALIDDARAVGARYLSCSFPYLPPDRIGDRPLFETLPTLMQQMTPADWKSHSDFLNRTAERVSAAGLKLAYHNHDAEFTGPAGQTGFDIVLAETDSRNVAIELDCGWAYAGGRDPVKLLASHGRRIRLLHLKDVERGQPTGLGRQTKTVPVGDGAINWPAVFEAGAKAGVVAAYVEQEPPFSPSPKEAAARSLAYLKRIGAA